MIDMRRTKIGSIDYAAGGQKFLNLPKDFPYLGLNLRLTGRLTISGGTTSGTPWEENPMTLIERIRVYGTKLGGAVEVVNIDAATLVNGIVNPFKGTKQELMAVSSGAAAAYDFAADIEVPLHSLGLVEEAIIGSSLPAHIFDELTLEIKWRDGSQSNGGGLISGGDRALALTAYGSTSGVPSISVVGKQLQSIDFSVFRPGLSKIYKKTLVTEAIESARKEPLNKGSFYRTLLFKAFTDANERPLSNSFLNNVRLLISGNAKEDWPFNQLQAENKGEFNLEVVNKGYGIIDFCQSGDPSTMLDTTMFAVMGISLETELNIAGAASGQRVEIVTLEAIPAGSW